MLRGNEAIEDEEYSRKLCESLGVEFFSTRIDIHKISKEKVYQKKWLEEKKDITF